MGGNSIKSKEDDRYKYDLEILKGITNNKHFNPRK